MWIAKFKMFHKNCILRPVCVKYDVIDMVYLVNAWEDNDKFYYTEAHILIGEKENINKFVKELKKEKGIKHLEQNNNFLITLNEESIEKRYYLPLFDKRFIQVKPVIQRTDGFEDWELACWEKEPLTNLIKKIPKEIFDIQLISIQKIKLDEIFLPHISPNLSKKQKEALNIAIKNGYYNFPRKNDLGYLAKIMKISRQTYQEHLRKAEKKLIPFLTENINEVN